MLNLTKDKAIYNQWVIYLFASITNIEGYI